MRRIAYKAGYKYQLAETYTIRLPWLPPRDVRTHWIAFLRDGSHGLLTIRCGYAWDGPSGPAIDTTNFMRGSLVHDSLYQLIREGHLSADARAPADRLLRTLVRQDGMTWLRAWWVYQGVRWAGGPAADPRHAKPVRRAP